MAIHTEEQEEIQGFAKEIDMGALSSILDNLQVSQYQHPQKSAIRELVSNGLDAVREKNTALSILSGKTKVEDHYIFRDDPMNRDSNFNPGYYDPKWLLSGPRATAPWPKDQLGNVSPDTVYITYEEGSETQKDKVVIEDYGVGMGHGRIEGYFKIGYSTKRNTAEALGKFGIGAKAGLATAPFYTMTSRHNGKEYAFNVYPHTVVSITPKLNLDTGKLNGVHIFSNGATIYYRETKMPNGTRIELESKKHHKQLYIDAVKSQLLYFDNVEFRVKNDKGGMDVIPIKARIIYEDENILLSDNNQYSKPHVLISRVNYGYVDWRELELEDVQGNIAFKIPAEQVKVNPSRESLVWNDFTRNTVVSYFEKIRTTAESMIAEQLKVEDFMEWIEACSQIQARYASDSVIGRLSQLVDMSSVKVPYSKDPTIVFGPKMFSGILVRNNRLHIIREGSSIKYRVDRHEYGIVSSLADGLPMYIQKGIASFKIDKYLLQEEHESGFLTIKDPFVGVDEEGNETRSMKNLGGSDIGMILDAAKLIYSPDGKRTFVPEKEKEEAVVLVKNRMWKIMEYLLASPGILRYEEVVVPEDFDAKEEVEDEKTIEQVKAKEERQKMVREKGVIPIFTLRNEESSYLAKQQMKLYDWQKIELPVADIDKWDEDEVYFANEKDSSLLHLAAMITRPEDKLTWNISQEFESREMLSNQSQAYQDVMRDYFAGSYRETNGSYLQLTPAKSIYSISFDSISRCHNYFDTTGEKTRVKLIKVAQDRVKFFLDFKPIQKFFMDIKNKKLTMSNTLVKWNTARMIHEELHKLRFLQNFERFNSKYCLWYRGLVNYVKTNYRELKEHSKDDKYYALRANTYDELVSHMDKVTQFQLFVRDHPEETEKIGNLAKEMFNPQTEVNDGLAIEVEFYDRLKELLDFAQPISTLLNEVQLLTDTNNKSISEDIEGEIRHYMATKGIL